MQNQTSQITALRCAQLVTSMFLAAALVACGGGGSTSTGQTSFTSGAISGFGSVIINGIRFDDSSAAVSNDDDGSQSKDDLKLGMMAEIEGSSVSTDDTGARHGAASNIRFGSEVVGPVGTVGATSLTVLGQIIDVTTTTIFDDSLADGLASIQPGNIVEVYGLPGATPGQYTATRIELKSPPPQSYKLRGVVSDLDTTAKTFTIGGETISYGGLSADKIPANLANGQRVRVKLQTTQVSGAWVATKLKSGVRSPGKHDEAELKGLITEFTTIHAFSVNGIPVDATNATFLPGDSGVVLGARVEVKGTEVDGVIIAKKVKLESEHDVEVEGFELHGTISSLNTEIKTFSLRGVTVSYATTSGFDVSKLVDGVKVEVKGSASADRTSLNATRIKFEG
jgi:Domain of unknown function (DUF5666)